jgi:hypothetical protein
MGFGCGCTATAPMESDAITPPPAENTGSVSVNGTKATLASAPAAFVDFQTPPPVVPR